MKRLNLDLADMQAFVWLAESGSFRIAAEQAGLSGPAMSRLIARVEDRVGARLFDRDTRNVALTPQGHRFLTLAERLVNEAQSAMADFDGYLDARRGQVTIAGLPSTVAGLLSPVVSQFADARSGVQLRIVDALAEQVAEAVLSGKADLGFCAMPVQNADNLIFDTLIEDDFMAVGAPGGPLEEDRPYTWQELTENDFVAISPGTSVRTLMEAALTQNGINLSPRIEVTHVATALTLVIRRMGVTALPYLALHLIGNVPMTVRPLISPSLTRRIGMIRVRDRTLSPAARAFMEAVLDHDHSMASPWPAPVSD